VGVFRTENATLAAPTGQAGAVAGEQAVRDVPESTGDDGKRGKDAPGKPEMRKHVQDGIGVRAEDGVGDDGNAVQGFRLDAEGRQEPPGRVGLTGSEAKDVPRVMVDDERDPGRAQHTVSVEKDHRSVSGRLDHGAPALRVR
jgi:hypothetical protein